MPARVIRGYINASRSLSRVSMHADLTFRALLVAADDYGRFDAEPRLLKAALYPLRDEVTPADVRGWVDELAGDGCVRLYEVDGREFLELKGWERHRCNGRRAKTSKFPDPPGVSEPSEETPGDPRISGTASPASEDLHTDPPVGRWSGDEGRSTSGVGSSGVGRLTSEEEPAPPAGRVGPGGRRTPKELVGWVQGVLGDRDPPTRALYEVVERLPEREIESLLSRVRARVGDGGDVRSPVAYFTSSARDRIAEIDARARPGAA